MKWLWVSCRLFTAGVQVDDHGIITDGAPIMRKFIGQPYKNLIRWANRFPPVEEADLDDSEG